MEGATPALLPPVPTITLFFTTPWDNSVHHEVPEGLSDDLQVDPEAGLELQHLIVLQVHFHFVGAGHTVRCQLNLHVFDFGRRLVLLLHQDGLRPDQVVYE